MYLCFVVLKKCRVLKKTWLNLYQKGDCSISTKIIKTHSHNETTTKQKLTLNFCRRHVRFVPTKISPNT